MELATATKIDARLDLTRGIRREQVQAFLAQVDAGSDRTLSAYEGALRRMFVYFDTTPEVEKAQDGDTTIYKPTEETMHAYRQHLKDTLRPRSGNLYLTAARLFFKWLQHKGQFPNITEGLKGIKTPRNHSKMGLTEAQALLITQSISNPRDKAMIALMIATGIRCVSVSRANVRDFYNQGGKTIIHVWDKGAAEPNRKAVVPDFIAAIVWQYLGTRGNISETDPLFVTSGNRSRNNRLTPKAIGRIITDAIRAVGIKDSRISAHSTRHTFATVSSNRGCNIRQVQSGMGHAPGSPATFIYFDELDALNNPAPQIVAAAIWGENGQNL